MKFIHHLCFATLTLTLLSGCGFAPYSVDSLPTELNQAYYKAAHPYDSFEVDFKKRLKACKITLLPAPKKSSPIINVSSNYEHTTSNPASSTQGRIYTLKYNATIIIRDFYNKTLLPPQTITVTRDVALRPNEIFETTPQIIVAKEEMIKEMSIKALNILSAKKTFEALQKLNK